MIQPSAPTHPPTATPTALVWYLVPGKADSQVSDRVPIRMEAAASETTLS